MLWRVVGVGKVGLGRKVAFELDPVQALDVLVGIRLDEDVQLAIGDAQQDEAIGAGVLRGFRNLNAYLGIARGDHRVSLHRPLGGPYLSARTGARENYDCDAP